MKRPLGWCWWLGWLLVAGCSAKPASTGPFAPLVARLPADSDLVALVDLAALGRDYTDLEQELLALPAVAANPGIRQLIEEQQSLVRSMLKVFQAKLGLDPLHGLQRAALGLVLAPQGDPQGVALVEASFPPDLFTRLGLSPTGQKVAGQAVFAMPDGGVHWVLLDQKLLVLASPARLAASLQPGQDALARLLTGHPDLFAGGGQGFELRASFRMPAWLRTELAGKPIQIGISTLVGLGRASLEIGPQVVLTATAIEPHAAANLQALFEAEAEAFAGGQHMIRGLGYWLLALDLEAIPDLPPRVAQALDNRPALLESLEQFFPDPGAPAPVSVEGLRVRLSAERRMLKGAALLIGMAAGSSVAFLTRLSLPPSTDSGRDER